nr:PEPxxWA-CTERM sorting domain-containing protein [Sphingomonas vulcanisoli]
MSAIGSNKGPAASLGYGDYTAGYADFTYSVMITSPDDLWVPYDYSGIATASAVSNGGLGRATSEIDINGNTALLVDSGCPNCGAQGAFDLKGTMQTNTVYTLYLKTYVDTMGPGQTAAYIDPYLTIDSDYLQSHPDLSLEFSDGVSNAPASASVPEPASWTMMIGGLGLVGGTMRRRKMAMSF